MHITTLHKRIEALAIIGLVDDRLRLPLVPVQESTRQRLAQVLGELELV